tara:strand:- start:41 stop:271 length:231 start_codon:yes stop_codon:yes gene_type:complete
MSKIPNYYIGSVYKYEARKVIEDFNLSYNSGVAVSYLLRAGVKSSNSLSQIDKQIDDIKKAIAHLNFEVDKLNNKK